MRHSEPTDARCPLPAACSLPPDVFVAYFHPPFGPLSQVFLYLSDVEEGGQTVFPKVDRQESQGGGGGEGHAGPPEAASSLFKRGSWESKMVDQCYTRFSVAPKKGDALLFYSQVSGTHSSTMRCVRWQWFSQR